MNLQKKILVFINQPIGLSETFIYNQVTGLSRYQPVILGTKLPPEPRIHLDHHEICLINHGDVPGKLHEWRLKIFGQLPTEIRRWIDRHRPVLIHAHGVAYGAIALRLAQQYHVPLLVSVHGTDITMRDWHIWRSSSMAHRLYLLRRRQLTRSITRLVVQSDFLRRLAVAQHGFDPERIVCIRHGVDLNNFQPIATQPEAGHILYVGRLIELKGLSFLIEAATQLLPRCPDLRLTVIGDGPMRATYEALAHRLLGERVTFAGAQPSAVVHHYLQRADVFCMPSITMPSGEAESQGMVFIEAMAMHVPPVSFASGGIPEVIRHGETGFLAAERNVEELAHYMGLLITNRTLRNTMGQRGRQWVEQEFNLAIQNAKLEALYDEVINNVEIGHRL